MVTCHHNNGGNSLRISDQLSLVKPPTVMPEDRFSFYSKCRRQLDRGKKPMFTGITATLSKGIPKNIMSCENDIYFSGKFIYIIHNKVYTYSCIKLYYKITLSLNIVFCPFYKEARLVDCVPIIYAPDGI